MSDFDRRAELLYDANKKSLFVTYLFWFFLGWFSIHRFYLRKWETGTAQVLLFGFGLSMMLMPAIWADKLDDPRQIGLILFGLWGAWFVLEILLIPSMVRKFNVRLVDQVHESPR